MPRGYQKIIRALGTSFQSARWFSVVTLITREAEKSSLSRRTPVRRRASLTMQISRAGCKEWRASAKLARGRTGFCGEDITCGSSVAECSEGCRVHASGRQVLLTNAAPRSSRTGVLVPNLFSGRLKCPAASARCAASRVAFRKRLMAEEGLTSLVRFSLSLKTDRPQAA